MNYSSRYMEANIDNSKKVLLNYPSAAPEETIAKYIQLLKDPAQQAMLSKGVVGLLDVHNLAFKYIVNTEFAVGISAEYFLSVGIQAYFESMVDDVNNYEVVPTFIKFLIESTKAVAPALRPNFLSYLYGVNHVRQNGVAFLTLLKVRSVAHDENGLPTLCLFSLEDIGHLAKKTVTPRMRISFKDDGNNSEVFSLSMEEKQLKKGDLFSGREVDVLKCLLKGDESKEIAEKLFISSNTVDNHRKNMIRKIDARDTTALVQLCKMLGVLQ